MRVPHFQVDDLIDSQNTCVGIVEDGPAKARPHNLKRPTILCVDDDPDLIRTLQIILSNYDVNIVTEYDAHSGIWGAACSKPDLIIADWRMPRGGGEALLTSVKGNRDLEHVPVLILSAQRNKDIEKRAFQAGAELFLHKPIRQKDLLQEIENYVALRKKNWGDDEE
jgi:CheY-like chemotaxis protein